MCSVHTKTGACVRHPCSGSIGNNFDTKSGDMKLLVVVLFAALGLVASQCVSSNERTANAVELKFYRVQESEWTDNDHTSTVVVKIIAEANSYCASNPTECGLTALNASFKESMVYTVTGYPQNSLKDMLLKVALDLPENSTVATTPSCVVPQSVLQTIVGNAREEIHDSTGFWITYIDDGFYGIPPPTKLNQIIIPIAFAVILVLGIMTILLNVWNKRREESLRRKKIIEQRKAKSSKKSSPEYVVDKSDPIPPSGITGANEKKEKPKRKDQLYKDSLKKQSEKKTRSIASEDSAIRMDTDTRHRQAFSYEKELDGATGYDNRGYTPAGPPASHLRPLESNEEDYERSPEKKKKKKKKSGHDDVIHM
ncbi:hypothetical protein ACF0H5_022331 [Mactra antiquata]